jgi:hypothetical protein
LGAPWNWLLVLLLTVFAIAPLTYPGFFEAGTGFLPAFGAVHPLEAPEWAHTTAPAQGEGQLPYLLAWPFYQFSGSGVVAVKWGYGLAFALGALGVYAWARRWLGSGGGVLAATAYTYLPWHLGTVYERGAYAEAWLWAFWPWLLWAVDRFSRGQLRFRIMAGVAGLVLLGGILWTQPGLALLSLPLLLAYGVMVDPRQRRPAIAMALVIGLALLLLWVLAQIGTGTPSLFQADYLYPFQLLSARWSLGAEAAEGAGQPSFQLGVAATGLTLVALALWLAGRRDQPRVLEIALGFWAGTLAVFLFLSLRWSAPLWEVAGLQAFVAHPWQVLTLAGLPLAFLSGALLRLDHRLVALPAWGGLLAFVVLSSYFYLAPDFTEVDPGSEPAALFEPVSSGQPEIMLLDYQVRAPTELEPTLALTLTWQTVAPLAEDYTVFLHVLRGEDERVAQRDSQPCDGACPTSTWVPGDIVVDRHQLTLTAEAVSGPLRLALGLYVLDSGQRAAVASGGDMVILDAR